MVKFALAVLAVFVVISSLYEAEAIKCYIYPKGQELTTGEQSGCKFCSKTVAKSGSTEAATKGCLDTCTPNQSTTTGGGHYCCNDKDFCNGAGNVRVNLLGASIAVLVATFWASRA